jgi:hypothetical protein
MARSEGISSTVLNLDPKRRRVVNFFLRHLQYVLDRRLGRPYSSVNMSVKR